MDDGYEYNMSLWNMYVALVVVTYLPARKSFLSWWDDNVPNMVHSFSWSTNATNLSPNRFQIPSILEILTKSIPSIGKLHLRTLCLKCSNSSFLSIWTQRDKTYTLIEKKSKHWELWEWDQGFDSFFYYSRRGKRGQ